MNETYNGWSNWETWNANLWLSNDQGSWELVNDTVQGAIDSEPLESHGWRAGDAIHELVEQLKDEGIRLIGDEMTMHRVDWREIAEHWLEV